MEQPQMMRQPRVVEEELWKALPSLPNYSPMKMPTSPEAAQGIPTAISAGQKKQA